LPAILTGVTVPDRILIMAVGFAGDSDPLAAIARSDRMPQKVEK
jgi:hypothetical protein